MRYLPATALLLVAACSQSHAQLIEVTPLPVITTGYTPEVPAQRRSMGHVSIPLGDVLADPFSNPADIVRGANNLIFVSPSFSSWTVRKENARPASRWIVTEDYRVGATSADAGIIRHNGMTGISFMAGLHHDQRTEHSTYQSYHYGSGEHDTSFNVDYVPIAIGWGGWLPGTGIALGGSMGWTFIDGAALPPFFHENSAVSQTGHRYEARIGASAPSGNGLTKMLAGYTAMNLGEGLYTDRRHTWFAQLDHRISVSERIDLGARGLVNLSQRNESSLDWRMPVVSAGFTIGTGAAWHAPWGTVAAEYIIEPLSSATTLERARLQTGTDGQLTARSWHLSAEQEDEMLNHIIRAGMEIPVSGVTVVRFGSQARINRYDCRCTNNWGVVEMRDIPVRWTELSITGGVEVVLGTARLLADGEVTSGRGIPDLPSLPSIVNPGLCPIPLAVTGSRHEAPMVTGRITFLWQPEF